MTNVLSGVLFLDIVRYSRLSEERQAQALRSLDRIIAESDSVSRALRNGQVRIHPRGDGKLLIFSEGVHAALHAAAQINYAVHCERPFELRMGVHHGSVRALDPARTDSEVVGEGVDTARRIMDVGDEGHILLSAAAAEFAQYDGDWHHLVHYSGDCCVKHGAVLRVFSLHGLYMNQRLIGSETPPHQVFLFRQDKKVRNEKDRPSKRHVYFASLGIGSAITAGFLLFLPNTVLHPKPTPPRPIKSSALPTLQWPRQSLRPQRAVHTLHVVKHQRQAKPITPRMDDVIVPDFLNADIELVETYARQHGLTIVEKLVSSDIYGEGTVIKQAPSAGKWPAKTSVVVYVSKGNENAETPAVPPQDQETVSASATEPDGGAQAAHDASATSNRTSDRTSDGNSNENPASAPLPREPVTEQAPGELIKGI